jgi:glutamyl-Q tRNA(Asp) synthetase
MGIRVPDPVLHRPSPGPAQPVFRFAPSPNGRLHLGHAYSALLNAELARAWGGRFLLRIEDIDVTRCRPELAEAIEEDLHWLGVTWERPVRRQSEHFEEYRAAFAPLHEAGLAYPCFCTRAQIATAVAERERASGAAWPRDPDGSPLYPGTCRSLPAATAQARAAAGESHAWRLASDRALSHAGRDASYVRFDRYGCEETVATAPARWGDAVLVRKEVPTSYHLAVVVDDAGQGVTHVVRGADLEAATDLHVLMQRLLGLPTPRYHHHPLIRAEGGLKLSKSVGSTALADLRARGVMPDEIRATLGFAA